MKLVAKAEFDMAHMVLQNQQLERIQFKASEYPNTYIDTMWSISLDTKKKVV